MEEQNQAAKRQAGYTLPVDILVKIGMEATLQRTTKSAIAEQAFREYIARCEKSRQSADGTSSAP